MQNPYNVWSQPAFYQPNFTPWHNTTPATQNSNYNPPESQFWPQFYHQPYQQPPLPQSYEASSGIYSHREFTPTAQSFSNPNYAIKDGRYKHRQRPYNSPHYQSRPYKNDRQRDYNSNSATNKNNSSQRNTKNNQIKPEKNKKKKNLIEDFPFNCDICDRGFKTELIYKEHIDCHEKCPKENCNYFAVPKLVKIHIKMHHDTGLAKKIWNMESQEEIEKWIAERKRNFPTTANIAKKKFIMDDKISRGEVLESKSFHHRPGMPRGKHRYSQTKHLKRRFRKNQSYHSSDRTVENDTLNLKNASDQHSSSLDLLVNNYNSDNPEQDENNVPLKKKHAKLLKLPEFPRPPWESKVFLRIRPTLLEKLLAKEIRHERNIILQCTHYIVENNFFQNKPL
ncbi:fragile X mental retardation-interacting 1-like [Octopus vulgaris]|uniref:Fragile X mental retardation-interacting 1-like n=1 Tax=Octopus vulgaris TaxID=6645 RepID=A0AA36AFX8_OCTVU|nr:fragile X mental retardation-interacting 1-like [Octopus vulgaris]